MGQSITGLDAGDVDADGDPDLLVSQRELSSVAFMENDGAGGFALLANIGMGWQIRAATYGDLSGDGIGDLVGLYSLPPGGFGSALLTMVRGVNFRAGTASAPVSEAPSTAALTLSAPIPNPSRGEARFQVVAREAGIVRVEVFDALGRRVARLHEGRMAPGEALALQLDLHGLAAGTYAVLASADGASAVRRVTVVR